MDKERETYEEGEEEELSGDKDRRIDIEDQGQAIDVLLEVDPDVEAIEGDESEPGPEGIGAKEATQKSGEAPCDLFFSSPIN